MKYICNNCPYGELYRKGYNITMMDDECGGCTNNNCKYGGLYQKGYNIDMMNDKYDGCTKSNEKGNLTTNLTVSSLTIIITDLFMEIINSLAELEDDKK